MPDVKDLDDYNESATAVLDEALTVAEKQHVEPRLRPSAKTKEGFVIHDVVIVGGGPAALTAAIYTTRDDIETIIYEKAAIGGIPAMTDWIENYPGFPEGISGLDFADKLSSQAEKFGAKIEPAEVTALERKNGIIKISTTDGEQYAKVVLIATGSDNKKLGIPGEDLYYARGVHYCATCDGAFYRDKNIVVVGGGNSAVQEALFLTKFAKHVDLLARNTIKASDILVHKLGLNDKITVHLHTVPTEIVGSDDRLEKIITVDAKTGQNREFKTDGVFVFIGQIPNTGFLKATKIEFDEAGFIKTNSHYHTAIEGVFAAGDAHSGATMQIACAVGEGAAAAMAMREYLHHAPQLNYENIEE